MDYSEKVFSDALATLERPDGVILAPTETVYGLLCAQDRPLAQEKIYQLKNRPKNKLLANFVPNLDVVRQFVPNIPSAAVRLAERFCPGPITIVFPDGNGSTFGFRIPDHPFVLELLKRYGKAISSTSANLSGEPAALSVNQALQSLTAMPDCIVDGGVIPEGSLASTVVKVNADNTLQILRPGPISEAELLDAIHA